jgi:hypothetical protein
MSALQTIISSALWCTVFFMSAPWCFAADLYINEVFPNPDQDGDEWVEIFNQTDESVDVTDYYLLDEADKQFSLEEIGVINKSSFAVFRYEGEGWLNNSGDTVKLFQSDKEIDVCQYPSIEEKKSYARIPDGGDWVIADEPTPGETNGEEEPSPSPTPQPTLKPSPETEEDPKAVLQIAEVTDSSGEKLSSVKIYLDGEYMHHYAPEEIEFCSDCKDGEIKCDFGEHTIKLEKSGYYSWEENKKIEPGKEYEINVALSKEEKDDEETDSDLNPSIAPSPIVSASPSPTASPAASPEDNEATIATISGQVLGATKSAGEKEQGNKPEKDKKQSLRRFLPIVFILSGIGLTGFSGYFFVKDKTKS